MRRIGVILGSGAHGPRGEAIAAAAEKQGAYVMQRHSGEGYRLPHRIDHVANLQALRDAGCERALGVSSVGLSASLNRASAKRPSLTRSIPALGAKCRAGLWGSTSVVDIPKS